MTLARCREVRGEDRENAEVEKRESARKRREEKRKEQEERGERGGREGTGKASQELLTEGQCRCCYCRYEVFSYLRTYAMWPDHL